MLNLYQCRHGQFFHFSNDTCIGLSLARYGEWAEYELYSLHHFIRPGMTILDVGSNVGTHAIAFGRMVGPEGKVIAIEAQPLIHKILSSNIVHNRMDNIFPLNLLAGAAEGMVPFKQARVSDAQNFGAVSFGEAETVNSDDTLFCTNLPVVPLDKMELSACDLIKIDVEGMELDVLSGGIGLLQRFKPVIYFEQRSEHNFSQLFHLLKRMGYRLFWHVAYPFNSNNLNHHSENIFGDSSEVNVLAIPGRLSVDTTDMVEIVQPIFAPPMPADMLLGYPVPQYLPPVAADHGNTGHDTLRLKLEQREAEFKALMIDRGKAQEIMEVQARRITELEMQVAR